MIMITHTGTDYHWLTISFTLIMITDLSFLLPASLLTAGLCKEFDQDDEFSNKLLPFSLVEMLNDQELWTRRCGYLSKMLKSV